MSPKCPNPYCLQDREDADCPDCGAPQFPDLDWQAHKILQELKDDDDEQS